MDRHLDITAEELITEIDQAISKLELPAMQAGDFTIADFVARTGRNRDYCRHWLMRLVGKGVLETEIVRGRHGGKSRVFRKPGFSDVALVALIDCPTASKIEENQEAT